MKLTRRRPSGGGSAAIHAAYAGILDGRHLWIAVEPGAGAPALRDAHGGVLPLAGDPSDLLAATDGEGEWDVVCDGRPLTVDPFAPGPMRTPASPDGRWQLELLRSEEGHLRVRRSRRAPGVDVRAVAATDGGARVSVGDGVDALTVGDASYPVEDGAAVVPEGAQGKVLAQPGGLPLRRRANDLATPQQAVLLPEPLRWSPAGELVAR